MAVTTDQGRPVPASAVTAKQHRLRHPAPDTQLGHPTLTDTIQNGGTHSNIIFSHPVFGENVIFSAQGGPRKS